MDLTTTIAGIDTNLDDLQSGVEACSRAADNLEAEVTDMVGNGLSDGAMKRHAVEFKKCTRDQRGAIQELRENIALLKVQLSTLAP